MFHMIQFSQGMTYDHVELNFYLNGESLNCPVYGIKGTVFPVFYGTVFLFKWPLLHHFR